MQYLKIIMDFNVNIFMFLKYLAIYISLIFFAQISNVIKTTVLGSVLSIGTLKHSFLKFCAQQNLVNLVLTTI